MLCLVWHTTVLAVLLVSGGTARIMAPKGRIVSSGEGEHMQHDGWWQETENQVHTTEESLTQESATSVESILKNPRIRGPVAVLVDTEPESLTRAQSIWEDALNDLRYLPYNIFLMPYNESEKVGTLTIRNIDIFRRAVGSMRPSEARPGANNTGAVFFTVLKATQQVPPDSAVLVFTGRPPNDEDLAQLAVQTLIKKRCRLYIWWNAMPGTTHLSVVRLLRQVTQRSGGSFIQAYDYDDQVSLPTSNKTIIAVMRYVTDNQDIPIYLDSTVQGITITVAGNISGLRLQPPEGEIDINLQDSEDLRSVGAQVMRNDTALVEIYLDTSASRSGIWKLATAGVHGASAQDDHYDVIVEGYSRLGFIPANTDADVNALTGDNGVPLLFNVEGDISNITGVTVLDQTGREVKTTHYRQEMTTRRPDGSVSLELEVPAQELPTEPFYLQFKGHDFKGEQFTRLAYVQSSSYQQSRTLVVGLLDSSELFVLPGQTTRLSFSVTNNNSLPTEVQIACRSKYSNFINVQPFRLFLQPYQTALHVVTLYPQANVAKGSVDEIKFTATSRFESVTVPVLVYISDRIFDNEKPNLQYSFQTNCKGVDVKDCSSKSWVLRGTTQDRTSGLLRVISEPKGIKFDSDFTIGSRDSVTFTYSATCCNSKLNLYITDAQNNTAVYSLNSYDVGSSLSEGEIAAIALGIIILIIIIVVIVVVIVRKRRRTHTFQTHQTAR